MKLEMTNKPKKAWRRVFSYYSYLLVVWGFFRLMFRFPEVVEEVWFKPVIWLLPLFWVWFGDKERVKFFEGGKIKAILWGLGVGLVYAAVAALAEWGKMGGLVKIEDSGWFWSDIVGLGLVTAISEEMVFSGYIFSSIWRLSKNLWMAMGMTAVMAALIHIPMAVFVLNYSVVQLTGYLTLVLLVSLGNAWVMSRTKNVLSPILSHWLWGVVVYAFR